MVSTRSTSVRLHNTSHFGGKDLASADLVVWTYPGMPAVNEFIVPANSKLICAYKEVCQKLAEGRSHSTINLRELTRGTPYEQFVQHHMYYKVLHGAAYPHHVQSVVVCSLYQLTLEFCDKYDPTLVGSQAPIQVDFVLEDTAFAAFSYDERVRVADDANSGDEVQSLAAIQFLPFISRYVDRDTGFPTISSPTHLIANAWYGIDSSQKYGKGSTFPPGDSSKIAFLSMHLSSNGRNMVSHYLQFWIDYTANVGPVGARDIGTLQFLKDQGIVSYLSLCFTLMFQIPLSSPRGESILVVDVDDKDLPADILQKSERLQCNIPADSSGTSLQRFEYAFELLDTYATRGKVVITSRIHSALPCLAMGIPVVFVDSEALPGGSRQAGRTVGISDLFHVYRPQDDWTFDLGNMGPNPGVHRADRYRASFWNRLKRQSSFYADTARLYGMIPFQRLGKDVPIALEVHDLFHFIFTTDASTLNWRVIRAIEYVYYHHPNARVVVHSNSLPLVGSRLDIFTETGYDLVVERYDIQALLEECPSDAALVKEFVDKVDTFSAGKYWYSHLSDLVRYLILYKYGGIYLDTDMYTLQPFPKNMTNVLGFQDPQREYINGAAMIFKAKHPFLQKAIDQVLSVYTIGVPSEWKIVDKIASDCWSCVGPFLLTQLYRDPNYNQTIQALNHTAFQPIRWESAKSCFVEPQSDVFANLTLEDTFAFHLNTKETSNFTTTLAGTLCDGILHKFCIFCDEVHTQGKVQEQ